VYIRLTRTADETSIITSPVQVQWVSWGTARLGGVGADLLSVLDRFETCPNTIVLRSHRAENLNNTITTEHEEVKTYVENVI